MCIRDRIHTCCNEMEEQIIESVSEKFDTQINSLDDKISKVDETIVETVQNQIVMQSKEIESKCLEEMCIRDRTNPDFLSSFVILMSTY